MNLKVLVTTATLATALFLSSGVATADSNIGTSKGFNVTENLECRVMPLSYNGGKAVNLQYKAGSFAVIQDANKDIVTATVLSDLTIVLVNTKHSIAIKVKQEGDCDANITDDLFLGNVNAVK